jgi:GDPmannose 4,6-dehydratase
VNKIGLIFGVNGQDGSYLSEFLLEKGYKVIGVRRRSSGGSLWRLQTSLKNSNFILIEGDITDFASTLNIIRDANADEIYNLAAQSNVGVSFQQPLYTTKVCYDGVINILESMKFLRSKAKLYQASSSEIFGTAYSFWALDEFDNPKQLHYNQILKDKLCSKPFGKMIGDFQNEETPFMPRSPYAIAKLSAHHAVRLYREAYNLWAVGGILFNHESPRRGTGFVTRKITKWFKDFISWKNDIENPYKEKLTIDYKFPNGNIITYRDKGMLFGPQWAKLCLGNINSYRDWGYAREYVEMMWLMLQQDNPKDYVIGTGETHSVGDFVEEILKYYNIDISIDDFLCIDEKFKRPAEVPYLRADASLAERKLGWKPKTTFKQLVELMIREENGLD